MRYTCTEDRSWDRVRGIQRFGYYLSPASTSSLPLPSLALPRANHHSTTRPLLYTPAQAGIEALLTLSALSQYLEVCG